MNSMKTTPIASLRPSRGNALRPGQAGSAALSISHFAREGCCS